MCRLVSGNVQTMGKLVARIEKNTDINNNVLAVFRVVVIADMLRPWRQLRALRVVDFEIRAEAEASSGDTRAPA
jgi:hypothetical protein